MLLKSELDFLRESNNIEDEWDDQSLQDAILAWQFIKKQDKLTTENILETHKLLMRARTTIGEEHKGVFRNGPVWIGGREAKSWYAVPTLVEKWLYDVNTGCKLVEKDTNKHKERVCIKHHIDYESIHPFFDGNGRTGRIFMNWQREKMGLPVLVVWEKEKFEYYKWFQ